MDYPVRNYHIFADTDDDMSSWIAAINEEIQPVEGMRFPLRHGGTFDVKIDDKAFDEVSFCLILSCPSIHHLSVHPSIYSSICSYRLLLRRVLN